MFRLWHILALIAIGSLLAFMGWPIVGLLIIGLGLGIGLGGAFGYKGKGMSIKTLWCKYRKGMIANCFSFKKYGLFGKKHPPTKQKTTALSQAIKKARGEDYIDNYPKWFS